MKTASIRSIHNSSDRRGKPVAELRPILKKLSGRRLPDMSDLGRRFPTVKGDSGRFLEDDR